KIMVVDSERQRLLAAPTVNRLTTTITSLLEQYHAEHPLKTGLAKEELRSQLKPAVDQKLFQFALGQLVKKKPIVQDQAEVRLAHFKVTLQVDEQAMREKIISLFRDAGLVPPNIKDVFNTMNEYPATQVQQVIDLLLQEGMLIKVTESLYFHAGKIEQLAQQLTEYIKKEGEIDAPRFKDLTGLTRKFSIPLLEYFDKKKLTIRIGDKRVLRKS
ncbi:MAG TPA: selenocysteine-specific translation factor, partial [Desulfobacteraceae bacterium]|nr:selenocysteine-specific translation factor [Desulfobacteraceae bacterium]